MLLNVNSLPLKEIQMLAHGAAALCFAILAVVILLVAFLNKRATKISSRTYVGLAVVASVLIVVGMVTVIVSLQLNSEANRVNTVYYEISEISKSQAPLASSEDTSEILYTITAKNGDLYVVSGSNAKIIENENNISAIEFVTYAHANENGESVVKEINIYLPKSTIQ